MKRTIWTFILLLSVCGCTFNATYENRENDKEDAEKITDNFYALLQTNMTGEAEKLFSDTFFVVSGKTGFTDLVTKADSAFGNITATSLANWQTLVIKGNNARSEYVLLYNVSRTKKPTQETLTLRKEKKGIRIVGYHIGYTLQ